jgi:hypothetical protein
MSVTSVRDLTVQGVEANHDVARKASTHFANELRLLHRSGADNHITNTRLKISVDDLGGSNTAAKFDRQLWLAACYVADERLVLRRAIERTIEVNDVKPLGPFGNPVCRHRDRIITEYGLFIRAPLFQANTLAPLDVDGRYYNHVASPKIGVS